MGNHFTENTGQNSPCFCVSTVHDSIHVSVAYKTNLPANRPTSATVLYECTL